MGSYSLGVGNGYYVGMGEESLKFKEGPFYFKALL